MEWTLSGMLFLEWFVGRLTVFALQTYSLCGCGAEGRIIAGFSRPHMERDGISFPRLFNIQRNCRLLLMDIDQQKWCILSSPAGIRKAESKVLLYAHPNHLFYWSPFEMLFHEAHNTEAPQVSSDTNWNPAQLCSHSSSRTQRDTPSLRFKATFHWHPSLFTQKRFSN